MLHCYPDNHVLSDCRSRPTSSQSEIHYFPYDPTQSSAENADSTSLHYPYLQPSENSGYNSQYAEIQPENQNDFQQSSAHVYREHMSRNYTSSLEMALKYPESPRPTTNASYTLPYAFPSPPPPPPPPSVPMTGSNDMSLSSTSVYDQHHGSPDISMIDSEPEYSNVPTAGPTSEATPFTMDLESPPIGLVQHFPARTYTISPPDVGFAEPIRQKRMDLVKYEVASEESVTTAPAPSPFPTHAASPSWPSTDCRPLRGSPPPFNTLPGHLRHKTKLRQCSSESDLFKALVEKEAETVESQAQATAAGEEGEEKPEVPKAKRKSKMHPCSICGKPFPRPSGLSIHMNTHMHVKPYPCEYPGCSRMFTVKSNAKRHLRTHGVNPDLIAPRSDWSIDFEDPQVVPEGANPHPSPSKIKWMPLSLSSRFDANKSEGDSGSELDELDDDSSASQRYEENMSIPLRSVACSGSFGDEMAGQERSSHPEYHNPYHPSQLRTL
ncbi:hypothetical protein VKT23_016815 [Stygiomarasmius scandens]|uniref:C2H2-type domain-containing protein n=1 Tax=Marasmiellus scandens TaxID=2682957 RepID=A0ABR1IX38_9AGAR